MKRSLFVIALLAVAIGLTWQLGTTAPQKAPSPPSALANSQPKPIRVTVPDCLIPTGNCFVQGCSPAGACISIDLGSNKCSQPDGSFFNCSHGLTVHFTRCNCTEPCSFSISQPFCQ